MRIGTTIVRVGILLLALGTAKSKTWRNNLSACLVVLLAVSPVATATEATKPARPLLLAADVTKTRIDSLGLKVDRPFGYWFDYGDDWWHQIDVVAIDDKLTKGKYPKVTKRVGKSPPQYMDEEE